MSSIITIFNDIEFINTVDKLITQGTTQVTLNFPFSDPTCDSPELAQAAQKSLSQGISFPQALKIIRQVTKRHPHVQFHLRSYLNPVVAIGEEIFMQEANKAGISACTLVDLPKVMRYEGNPFDKAAKLAGITII